MGGAGVELFKAGKGMAGGPWRLSAKLLIVCSVLTVIGFSAICVNVMLDMRRGDFPLPTLAGVQKQSGQPFFDVLRLRADSPDLSSTEMAESLTAKLGRTISSANLRQLLHRARERFAELLLNEVCQSLEGASEEQVLEELAELNLLKYCQDVLDRRKPG